MKKILTFFIGFFLVLNISGIAGAVTVNVTETFGSGQTAGCFGIDCLPDWTLVYSGPDFDVGYSDYYSETGTNDGNRYMWVEDEAVIAAKVNTTGFDSIEFDFDIRSINLEDPDRMKIGWVVSAAQPTGWADFTELASLPSDETWTHKNYMLGTAAADTPNLWIGYSLYGDEGEQLFSDNILVSGSPLAAVPEPSTLFLLGSGLAGLTGLRRWKGRM
ncbi:MAG: PEP-CTERM sorting domain-containing protein [bacterium]